MSTVLPCRAWGVEAGHFMPTFFLFVGSFKAAGEREKKIILAYRSHAKTHLDSAGVRELTEIAGLCPENRSDLVYWSRSEFQSQCCMHTYGRRWLRATMNTFVPLTWISNITLPFRLSHSQNRKRTKVRNWNLNPWASSSSICHQLQYKQFLVCNA